jgi:hypothetical protein
MATYFFRNTGSTNWSLASNWSLTSGGGATGAIPTNADIATLDANSGSCTLTAATSVCLSLNCTGYTRVFTFNGNLQVGGNITFSATMTIATDLSTRSLRLATGTITSNGQYLPITIVVVTGSTFTFADDFDCLNTAANFSGTFISNSATLRYFKIRGNFLFNGLLNSLIATPMAIRMTGTGNVTSNGFVCAIPFEIDNGAGNTTFIVATHNFSANGGYPFSFKYTTGNVTSTGATIVLGSTTTAFKANLNTLVLETVSLLNNVELVSALTATNINFPANANGIHVITGSFGFTCDYLNMNTGAGTYRTITLNFGNTYIVNKLISTPFNPTGISGVTSSSGVNRVALTLNGGSNLIRCNMERVNASGGVLINTIGIITNCSNVGTSTQNVLI